MEKVIRNWTAAQIPLSKDGLAVITGSTEGIGFEDALALSAAGWQVIIMGAMRKKERRRSPGSKSTPACFWMISVLCIHQICRSEKLH